MIKKEDLYTFLQFLYDGFEMCNITYNKTRSGIKINNKHLSQNSLEDVCL
jgi:hypothetical protein